jgi:septation ring formation regulator EzrA
LAGYSQAQKLLAIYQANLAAVRIRRQAQQDSVQTLDSAQRQIQSLLASTPTNPQVGDRNRTISQLQGIPSTFSLW